MTFNKTDV